MAVKTIEEENTSNIPPARLFKAFVLDADNLLPKILPDAIKSIEIVEGNGGPGTIKLVTFGEASQYKSAKHRIDSLDEGTFSYSYTIIEGDILGDELELVSNTVKLEASPDGGSICKNSTTFHGKGDAEIPMEKINAEKEKAINTLKAVVSYLESNPDA